MIGYPAFWSGSDPRMRAPPLDLADQLICSSSEDGEAVGDRLILQNIKHGVVGSGKWAAGRQRVLHQLPHHRTMGRHADPPVGLLGDKPAQGRLALDVRRRREKPTDLFRAENNGEAARLADRHDLVNKIAALQRDLEEKRRALALTVDQPSEH